MTEAEIRETEEAQEKYRTAWIEAGYIVAGWEVAELDTVLVGGGII